jgi:hypothetical protein
MKNLVLFVMTLVSGLLLVGINYSHASMSLDYTLESNSLTSVIYNPTNPYVIANNIGVTEIVGNGTPSNGGSALTIQGGALSFTTGALTSQSGNIWTFGNGGTLTLAGGISQLSIGNSSNLVTGSFTSATLVEEAIGSYQFNFVGATLFDTAQQSIYNYFGLPSNATGVAGLDFSFLANSTENGGFTSNSINSPASLTDVPNAPTPIPAAAYLLGSGLMGLFGLRRREEK